jgi:hypothetical protein
MGAVESVMPKANVLENSVSRAELDQRARETRLRLEKRELLLLAHAPMSASWLRQFLFCLGVGGRSRGRRTRGRLSDRRSSRMPPIYQLGPEISLCRAAAVWRDHPFTR